jgi:predicted double-glycine peptidase
MLSVKVTVEVVMMIEMMLVIITVIHTKSNDGCGHNFALKL